LNNPEITKDKYCLICERIDLIKKGENPYFVKELQSGYVVLGDYQYYKGYALFLCKKHVSELHMLEKDFRSKYIEKMASVGEAVFNAFKPAKLNYELLGNTDRLHIHWHFFPRYQDDLAPLHPVWETPKSIREAETMRPSPEQLSKLKKQLLDFFEKN
jgi:diadenosine tetraphosphate (Ap4A) HIT family hydrolase